MPVCDRAAGFISQDREKSRCIKYAHSASSAAAVARRSTRKSSTTFLPASCARIDFITSSRLTNRTPSGSSTKSNTVSSVHPWVSRRPAGITTRPLFPTFAEYPALIFQKYHRVMAVGMALDSHSVQEENAHPRNWAQRPRPRWGQNGQAASSVGGRCKFGGICNASRTLGSQRGCPLQARG
jgi:hypothetical protein